MTIFFFAFFTSNMIIVGANFLRFDSETSSFPLAEQQFTSAVTTASANFVTEVVDKNFWLRECVPPFKKSGFSDSIDYSNYYLRDKQHGLCADHLSCAFVDCAWTDAAKKVLQTSNVSAVGYDSIKSQLPTSNLPAVVTFPRNVKQLSSAMRAAKKRGRGLISVKTSGHSYHGSSTMRTSTQINLRSLTTYSASGIVECQAASTGACILARARGKKAIMRVGGGEAHDNTYRAVLEWNKNHANKYTVVGGGAGTVAAAGGWLQGGGLSTGLERHYGFGVDQVLEIEMVLADGTHVKFGPTEWKQKTGFIYPQTTVVTGYCNTNLVDNESQWQWKKCPKGVDIPFSDLWFAVRGGGGGTYGVVTAIQIQLHDYNPIYYIYRNDSALNQVLNVYHVEDRPDGIGLAHLFFDYFVDLFWNPTNLGLTSDISNSCGTPSITFLNFFNAEASFDGNFFMCEGSAARDAVIGAWKTFVNQTIWPKYPGAPVYEFFTSAEIGSYAEIVLQTTLGGRVPYGRIQDNPPPETISMGGSAYPLWSANVPIQWLLQKNDDVYKFFFDDLNGCHLIGGDTSKAHDQMTSVNPFQRASGLQCMILPDNEQHYRSQFIKYFKTSKGNFPGGTEYNHISPVAVGPLKTNWTTPCPKSYSKAQQASKCVSLQESVWGTSILSRLTSIKNKVDPDSSFNCHFCVGEKPIGSSN
mmetsp:Transcript_27305/g.37503  ORF Transcript_27305/g.37503 Transcript_27305/m.37503 type:complete len:696 (+) Transcript_27305:136-2223(+)